MTQAAPLFKISTTDLAPSSRKYAIRDYLEEMMRVEVAPLVTDAFIHYSANLRVVPGAAWGEAYTSAGTTRRLTTLLSDGQDDLMLITAQMPITVQPRTGPEFVVPPGDTVLSSQGREILMAFQGTGYAYCLRVSRRGVSQMVPRLSSAPVMNLPRQTPLLSLLWNYTRLLAPEPLAGENAQLMAGRQLQEMVALLVGGTPELMDANASGTLAAARLKIARADIEAHLDDANLSLEAVAARQKVSPRYLQRLFAREGQSFSSVLRRARLDRARAMLENPHNAGRSILSIALECGFAEASAMNRAFRQHYGAKPSELRWRP